MSDKEKKVQFKAKSKKTKKPVPTFNEIYATLMKGSHDRHGNEIPKGKWQPFQFFRYFCILYEGTYGSRFRFEPKANPFSLKELRDMKTLLLAFNNNALEVVRYLDWVFKVKSRDLPNLDGTALLRHQRMLNEYERKRQEPYTYRKMDPINEEYLQWVHENAPDLFCDYDFERMKDLYWVKEDYNDKEGGDIVVLVVEEGIRRSLVPREGNIKLR